VQAIVKQYRTRLGTLCLVCAALSVPLAFVQETAIALTLWMLFFFAGLALPYLPLLQANAKLKALKNARLVKSRRDGKTVFYSLADDHVKTIIDQGLEHILE